MGLLKEIETVAEDVTGTQTAEASAAKLIDFFLGLFSEIQSATDPAAAAANAATTVAANKAQLATAVAANP